MAAGILPAPGTKVGPCKTMCKHRDCAETRQTAKATCRFCDKAIGFGKAFFRSRFDGSVAHRDCMEDAVERNDARVGLF